MLMSEKAVYIERLIVLLDLLGRVFDEALVADDWVVMERSRVRSRAVVRRIRELLEDAGY